jgi:hypothetical protein
MQYEIRNDRMVISRKLLMVWEHMAIGFCEVLSRHLFEELGKIRNKHPKVRIDDLQNTKKIQSITP